MTEAIGMWFGADVRSEAASDAANAQIAAAMDADRIMRNYFQRAVGPLRRGYATAEDPLRPYARVGRRALGQLSRGMRPGKRFAREFDERAFRKSPGYQFRLDEGLKAIERQASARGVTGGTLKAFTRYAQDYAAGEYDRAFQRWNVQRGQQFARLSGLAGMGARMAGQQSGLRVARGHALSDLYRGQGARLAELAMLRGNIQAAGEVGQAVPRAQLYEGASALPMFYLATLGSLASGGIGGQPTTPYQTQPVASSIYTAPTQPLAFY